jgi:hypothetical protein
MSDDSPLRSIIKSARTAINSQLSTFTGVSPVGETSGFASNVARVASRMPQVVKQFRTQFPEIRRNYETSLVAGIGVFTALPAMLARGRIPGIAVGVSFHVRCL